MGLPVGKASIISLFQRTMAKTHYALADILLTLLGGCMFLFPMYASVHFLISFDESHQDHMHSHHRIEETGIPRNDIIQYFVRTQINYSHFRVNEPNFIDDLDRKSFLLEQHNLEQLQERDNDILTGIVEVIPNGTVHGDIDCGWRTNSSVFTSRPKHVRDHYVVLCPLLVSNSEYFQHFIDGVLPKLVQLSSIITFPGITYLFRRPRDRNIYEILEHVNLPGDSVAFYDGGHITSDYLINTCITPPLHPWLFSEAHNRLIRGFEDHNKRLDKLIILLTRNRSRKGGRRMLNMEYFISYLRGRYGHRLYTFHGNLTFSDSVKLFQRAHMVIGVHGGAFYNIIFAPHSTHIVELMPTTSEGEVMPTYIGHTIFWAISEMLNQSYWRINSTPTDSLGNIKVDIRKIEKVLDKIDRSSKK